MAGEKNNSTLNLLIDWYTGQGLSTAYVQMLNSWMHAQLGKQVYGT